MKIQYSDDQKLRLDKFLQANIPGTSRTQIQNYIKESPVTVNGKPSTVHHWLKNGDVIEGEDFQPPKKEYANTPRHIPEIISETDSYMVLNKPAGMLIHPTEQEEPHTLAAWLIEHDKSIASVGDDERRPGIVHRLDKDVGGLIVIAKTNTSFQYLKSLFQDRKITKKYYALVHGHVENDEGEITTPLRRDKSTGRMIAESATNEGKDAHTNYQVIKRYKNYTLLNVHIVTGRTHQIRAHLFSIGHSIVGDGIYRTRDIKHKRDKLKLYKPFLFAYHLSFKDESGGQQEFQLNLTENLQSKLDSLIAYA